MAFLFGVLFTVTKPNKPLKNTLRKLQNVNVPILTVLDMGTLEYPKGLRISVIFYSFSTMNV